MDSLTQVTLGAAVGEAVLGRQLGNRAIVWGAVFGTLPDMDVVLSPFQDSVQFLVHHRGLSHSLLAVAVVSPLLGWLFTKWYQRAVSYPRWLLFFLLVFLTHILLDCCTTYGTQIFAPFSDVRVAWNNVFIIDPLYTLPFLACVLACLFFERTSRWRRTINAAGLILSTAYLGLTLVHKQAAEANFAAALERQQIPVSRMMTCPTPLNSILWCAVAETEGGFHVGFYSLFDSDDDIEFQFIPRSEELLGDLKDEYAVERLIWFADGYYCVRPHTDGVLLHVMKFGKLNFLETEDAYAFAYLVRREENPGIVVERHEREREIEVGEMAARLWARLKGN